MKKDVEYGDKCVSKSAFRKVLEITFCPQKRIEKCQDDTSYRGLMFSIEIKLVEIKPAVRENDDIDYQDESKFTFAHGLWNFSDFDAGVKNIGFRKPSIFIDSVFLFGSLIK